MSRFIIFIARNLYKPMMQWFKTERLHSMYSAVLSRDKILHICRAKVKLNHLIFPKRKWFYSIPYNSYGLDAERHMTAFIDFMFLFFLHQIYTAKWWIQPIFLKYLCVRLNRQPIEIELKLIVLTHIYVKIIETCVCNE